MHDPERLELIAEDPEEIEFPAVPPDLECRPISDDAVLLTSESFNTILHGKLYARLLPRLDGTRTQAEIMKDLKGVHSGFEIMSALEVLAKKGYIISGDFEMSRSRAAFWSSLGANPCRTERRLKDTKVAVYGDPGESLAVALGSLGIRTGRSACSLAVHICEDFADQGFEAVHRDHGDSGLPYLMIRPHGTQPLISPVFQASRGSACWACLVFRIESNQPVQAFLRNTCGESQALRPMALEPPVLNIFFGMAAIEIAKWLALGDTAPLNRNAISMDCVQMACVHHRVVRVPHCSICADQVSHCGSWQPEPIQLKSSHVTLHNSGGAKAKSPSETMGRYSHLVGPITGVVNSLTRVSDEADSWLHVHMAGINRAQHIDSLDALRLGLRSLCTGKGSTSEQSKASALCEALERYSGVLQGNEIQHRRRFDEFLKQGDDVAIHPNDVQLFSARQFDLADDANHHEQRTNFVPKRFRSDQELDWTPVWSFSQNRHRYLPTALLYYMTPEQRGTAGLYADSNGCAAGNTLEEAILQGFFELVERDAFAIWWYNRLHCSAVNIESFGNEYLCQATDYYERCQREMWVLDLTHDLGIPVFVAVSRRIDGDAEEIIYGAGAHLDPKIAALRAVCEMNQVLVHVPTADSSHRQSRVDDPIALRWWRDGKIEEHPYLAPEKNFPPVDYSDHSAPDAEDLRDEVEWCRQLVEAKGMELLVLDQTRPDVGLPAVRVIVPGLRHFWKRLAPGRLYDVPVQMGWNAKIVPETEMNDSMVFA